MFQIQLQLSAVSEMPVNLPRRCSACVQGILVQLHTVMEKLAIVSRLYYQNVPQ